MSELLANPKICGACNKPGCSLKCACKLVFYCGEECQRAHWPTHKKKCRLALAKKVKDAKRKHGRDNEAVAMARLEVGVAHEQQGRYREAGSSAFWRLVGYIWRTTERGILSLLLFLLCLVSCISGWGGSTRPWQCSWKILKPSAAVRARDPRPLA